MSSKATTFVLQVRDYGAQLGPEPLESCFVTLPLDLECEEQRHHYRQVFSKILKEIDDHEKRVKIRKEYDVSPDYLHGQHGGYDIIVGRYDGWAGFYEDGHRIFRAKMPEDLFKRADNEALWKWATRVPDTHASEWPL